MIKGGAGPVDQSGSNRVRSTNRAGRREGIRASTFGEQEYRGMQSLCARGAGSGERSARVKGQSPWQVKGGSHYPVKRRFAT